MPLNAAADEQFDQSTIDNRVASVGHLFRDRCAATPSGDAFTFFEGDQVVTRTWAQTKSLVYRLAAGLIDLGVQVEDRVAVAAATSISWVWADLAIMCSGGATTTVYPTSIADDVSYILADSASVVLFADDAEQVEKVRRHRDKLPDLRTVVVLDGEASDDGWVITLADLEERGRRRLEADPDLVDHRIDELHPECLATLIYTSGTTGRPKGARLVHDCIVYEGAAVDSFGLLDDQDVQFLWLPLSHVMGKLLMALALQVGFVTAVDGRVDKIVDNMAVFRPTFMGAAPRIFEKAYGRISLMLSEGPPIRQRLVRWALSVGRQAAWHREQGRELPASLQRELAIADRLVLSKVRERFGGRVRFMVSGSAPLDPEVARWFASVGLLIIEGYGLTETSSASAVNRTIEGSYSFGTVGWPVPGTQFRVAEDGEILMKGPGVMRGYHGDPELTEQVMTDGWFHTGDIGTIDSRGFVRITDRKKDVFKTSGGKYVAPASIEAAFKGVCPYASQFVVAGNGRNYITALVTLDEQAILGWAAEHGLEGQDYATVVSSPLVREMVQGYVDELNAGLNRWETIKRFTILDRDLSIEDGELTPSLKLKRRLVTARFQDRIDALYEPSTG